MTNPKSFDATASKAAKASGRSDADSTAYNLVKVRVIYAVFPDAEMAKKIARKVVENRLAACANIFAPHFSIYRWNEDVETSSEVAVLFKTIDEKSEALIQFIRANHSYETPAILEFANINSTPDFASWLNTSCRP